MTSIYMCETYDQISDRKCRYYKDHGGPHRYARLDHDCAVERELRAQLDAVIAARDELADIVEDEKLDETWSKKQNASTLTRVAELRKVGT